MSKDHEGKVLIFTKFITLKNGKKLYAHECGKQAFAIWVDKDSVKKKK